MHQYTTGTYIYKHTHIHIPLSQCFYCCGQTPEFSAVTITCTRQWPVSIPSEVERGSHDLTRSIYKDLQAVRDCWEREAFSLMGRVLVICPCSCSIIHASVINETHWLLSIPSMTILLKVATPTPQCSTFQCLCLLQKFEAWNVLTQLFACRLSPQLQDGTLCFTSVYWQSLAQTLASSRRVINSL